MNNKVSIIITLLCLLQLSVFGQKPRIKFDRISLDKGLSQSSVRSILQDYQGFIWFATIDGLNKFDGYGMKVYWNNPADSTAVSDNVFNTLYETNNGKSHTLWVGTDAGGLCKYNRSSDNFKTYYHSDTNSNSIISDRVKSICGNYNVLWLGTENGLNKFSVKEEKFESFQNNEKNYNSLSNNNINIVLQKNNEILWIGTNNGLNKYEISNNKFKRFYKKDGLFANKIEALCFDENENLWIGTPEGICILENKSGKIIDFSSKILNKETLPDKYITSLMLDNDNIIWIGTRSGGLCRFDSKTGELYVYTNDPTNFKSLSTNNIISIYQDHAKLLWVGTSLGGVNTWNRAADELALFRHNPYDDNSLSSNQVRNIYIDKEQTIWIGTVEGGLNKKIVGNDKFIHFKYNSNDKTSISNNHVRSILEDNNNNFWVATDGGGLNKMNKKTGKFIAFKNNPDNPKSISNDMVWKVFQDSKNNLWVGTFGGGLNLMDTKTNEFSKLIYSKTDKKSICSDKITAIIEDKTGTIWIGTFGGLSKMNSDRTFENFTYNSKDTNSLSNNRIYSLMQDLEGFLWIGTKGGLNKYDIKNNKFTRYTTLNSEVPNNVFTGILEDDFGFLWISTNSGICRLEKKTGKIKNFDVRDGLQSNEFLAGSCFKSTKGELFFGGIQGFNAFFSSNIKENPNVPVMVITGFQISNEYVKLDSAISEKKQITLNYDQNDLSFDFVALDFIFSEKNKYAYKLDGYDEDWNYVKYRRFATYTNLQPGKYVFRIKGSNNDDVWNNEGTSVVVIIEPAFWQTFIFKLFVILLLLSSAISIYIIRINRVKKYNQQLQREVKEQTAEIREQTNEILKQKKEITDSIEYAKRIQTAALPAPEYLKENLPEHFILFKPKDIVSGDFYWAGRKGNKLIVTAADCTGHGVPGAFMSMLGISFLNKIVNEENTINPAEILNSLRENIIHALRQKGREYDSKDGMDISLCVIDFDTKKLAFSGAYNSLFLIQNNELSEVSADKMPVAFYDRMDSFKVSEIQLNTNDLLYMTSDGYVDQFGGPDGKKFMKKKLKNLLLQHQLKPMSEQYLIFDKEIEDWKINEPQIDDIVLIGIRI